MEPYLKLHQNSIIIVSNFFFVLEISRQSSKLKCRLRKIGLFYIWYHFDSIRLLWQKLYNNIINQK